MDVSPSEIGNVADLRYRRFWEMSQDGFLVCTADSGMILDANLKVLDRLGYSLAELQQRSFWDAGFNQNARECRLAFFGLQPVTDFRKESFNLIARDGHVVQQRVNGRIFWEGTTGIIQWILRDVAESRPVVQQMDRLTREIQILHQTSQELNRTLDLETLYDLFCRFIAGMMDLDVVYVSSYDPEEQLIRCVYGMAEGNRLEDVSQFPTLPLEAEGRGTQSRVIRSGEPWLIADLMAYTKTSQNLYSVDSNGRVAGPEELVEDEELTRSALIVPIKLMEQVVGVVQIFSYRLNGYSQDDLENAVVLASQFAVASNNARLYQQAQMEINVRKQTEDLLREREFWLNESQRLGQIGSYILDLASNTWTSSEMLDDIFGIDANADKSLAGWLHLVHPDQRAEMAQYFSEDVLKGHQRFDREYRIARVRDGVICWVWGHGKVSYTVDGTPLKMIGTIQDITVRKLAEEELIQAYDATLEGLMRALDRRDQETEHHSRRVIEMTMRLAREFNVSESELVAIRMGAQLHDIGKMGVPDGILWKAGALTAEEWVEMKKHPTYAYEIIWPIHHLRPAIDIPYCHHEKWDGSGYPRGLKGTDIPLAARIFAVVDVWDALNSDRPYRAAWPEEKIRAHILAQAGTHFDPEVVRICMASELLMGRKGFSENGQQ